MSKPSLMLVSRSKGFYVRCSILFLKTIHGGMIIRILVIILIGLIGINTLGLTVAAQEYQEYDVSVKIHEGNINGPGLKDVQVTAIDGNDRIQTQTTLEDGTAKFKGVPGSWKFNAHKDGFRVPDYGDKYVLKNKDRLGNWKKLTFSEEVEITKPEVLDFCLLHTISDNGKLLIENNEECKLDLYNDSQDKLGDCSGACTIGIGHLVDYPSTTCDKIKNKNIELLDGNKLDLTQGLTFDEAIELFDFDLREKSIDVNLLIGPQMKLEPNQFDALVDYAFQKGAGGLKNLLENANWDTDSIPASLQAENEYKERREKEAEIFSNGYVNIELLPIVCTPTPLEPGKRCIVTTVEILTPTLRWTLIEDADYYYVYLRDMDADKLIINQEKVLAPSTFYAVPDGKLDPNKNYRWNVRAIRLDSTKETTSALSDRLNFNTNGASYAPIEVDEIDVAPQKEVSQPESVQESSTSSSEWQNTGVVDAVQGNYEIAILCFDKAFELDPSLTLALYDKAVILNLQDKYDEAIHVCEKIIELDSRYGEAWNCKGYALLQQRRYDEAIQALDKAIEIYPKYADAWHNKGEALQGINRDTEANDAFAKADELGYDGPTPIDFGRYWSCVN